MKFKLRGLRFGVVNGAVDLRRRQIPPRLQFGGVELHDRVCPAFNLSPSCAKIFSTRPAMRGPTCTSSTSIVPETALFWRWQPENRTSATDARKCLRTGEPGEVAKRKRIDRIKVARHYVPETLGKEMAGYSERRWRKSLGSRPGSRVVSDQRAGGLSQAARAAARKRFVHQISREPAPPLFISSFRNARRSERN